MYGTLRAHNQTMSDTDPKPEAKAPPPARRRKRKKKAKQDRIGASARELMNRATFRGMLRYIQRPGASVRLIWEEEQIDEDAAAPYIRDVISWAAFQDSSAKGKWRARRATHWKEVKARVMEHAQTEAVKAEIAEIAELESVRSMVLNRITGNAAAGIPPALPKWLEGAVGAFVQLDKRISSKRDIISEQTAEASQVQIGASGTAAIGVDSGLSIAIDDTPLTDAEIEALSKTLARERAELSPIEDDAIELPAVLTSSPVAHEANPHGPSDNRSKANNSSAGTVPSVDRNEG